MLINSCFKLVGISSNTCLSKSSLDVLTWFPSLGLILGHTCQFSAWTESERLEMTFKTGFVLTDQQAFVLSVS